MHSWIVSIFRMWTTAGNFLHENLIKLTEYDDNEKK